MTRAKVFIIGLGKTGTTSLGKALEVLGYRNKTFDPDLVMAYANGDPVTIDSVLARYDSFDDFPWPLMYREMSERFPDARFVLTVRSNPERWFQSLCQHAWRAPDGTYRRIGYGVEQPQFHRRRMLAYYARHTEAVRSFFAEQPDRLLVMCVDGGDGWPELCRFLAKSVPQTRFIHTNKTPPFSLPRAAKLQRLVGYYLRSAKNRIGDTKRPPLSRKQPF